MTVTPERIAIAKEFGLKNVETAAKVATEVGLPFWAACTLLQKESGGRNVYGHDSGGVRPAEVPNARNFFDFLVQVMNGKTSNGVGPTQITYAGSLKDGHRDGGYFRLMAEQGLLPWRVEDNMRFGFTLLRDHKKRTGNWTGAATAYNGGADYGRDFVVKANEWRKRLGIKGTVK